MALQTPRQCDPFIYIGRFSDPIVVLNGNGKLLVDPRLEPIAYMCIGGQSGGKGGWQPLLSLTGLEFVQSCVLLTWIPFVLI